MAKTPEQIAAKYARNAAAAQNDWSEGVKGVTENPMAKAAASADLWQQRVSAPSTKDKFRRNVGATSMEEWKERTSGSGGRYAQGVQSAQSKMARHAQQVAPHMEALKRKIAAMPKGTPEAAAERARAWILGMAEYKRPS